MKTLTHGAGYLVIDHTDSPGLTPADVSGIPGAIATPAGQVLERDVMTCSHCQRAVVLNPGRVRARAVCPKCHHFVCDSCEAIRVKTGACVPFKAVLDRAATVAEKFVGQPDHPEARQVDEVTALQQPGPPRVVLT